MLLACIWRCGTAHLAHFLSEVIRVTIYLFRKQSYENTRSKLESNDLRGSAIASFPSVVFQLLQYSWQHPSLMTKTDLDDRNWLDLSSIFFKICRFRSSTLLSLLVFIPREATPKSSLKVAWFFWTNHNSLLRIVTNEIASLRLLHQWHTWLSPRVPPFVLTRFWRHLWSITVQTHGNLESIC